MLSHGQLDFVGITQGQTTFSQEKRKKRGLSLSYPSCDDTLNLPKLGGVELN